MKDQVPNIANHSLHFSSLGWLCDATGHLASVSLGSMLVTLLGRVTEGTLQNKEPMKNVCSRKQTAKQAPLLHPSIPKCNSNFFFCTRGQFITRNFCPLNWPVFTYLSVGIQMKDRE